MEINAFEERIKKDPTAGISTFLRKTRFSGKDKSMNSVIVAMIKSNLPENIVVKFCAKFDWELTDLVRYACAVRGALERAGVVQPRLVSPVSRPAC